MINIDSDKKRTDAISAFTNLLSSEGWKLVVEILDANIEVLQEQLEQGIENETKADVDRIRDKLRLSREFSTTPEIMIKKLEAPINETENPDPYEDISDIKKRKGEAVDKAE